MPLKIYILDAQAHAFHQAHARAIQKPRQQRSHPLHQRQQASHFVFVQHRRNALGLLRSPNVIEPRQINTQHLPVQKKQSTERLVVGGGRYLALIGQHGQKRFHIGHTQFVRVTHAA